ncbi:MAG: endonuclease III [Candidatus Gracilibacteria bacterium]|jgi:endonuclease-3
MRIIKRKQPGRVIQSRKPQQQMRGVLKLLKKHYPDAKCALIFKSPLELLIATMLSAQCTDEVVNRVTPKLFAKYKTAKAYADANLEELQQAVRSTGFYKNKGKNIQNACKMLIEKFNGHVPKTMQELILLPGVARKTANVVLFNAFGIIDGITVDTHVIRLSHRLGLSKEKTAEKIEQDLMKITPKKDWGMLSHYLIAHGRKICKAQKPDCAGCFLNKICPFIKSD